MLMIEETAPNMWAWLIVLTTSLAAIIGNIVNIILTRRQNPEIKDIKILVNGNLDREKKKNAALTAQLEAHGITPRPEAE